MHKILSDLLNDIEFEGIIDKDSISLLNFYGCSEVAEHSLKVALKAREIARRFGIDEDKAYIAGCLHDVGNVFPDGQKAKVCDILGIEVLDEERIIPSFLHPKLSKAIAAGIFGVQNDDILSAIECHSALKANAGAMDMVLMLADKTSWDIKYSRDFIDDIVSGLDISLEQGAFAYLNFLYRNKDKFEIYHPQAFEAYNYFSEMRGN